MNQSPELRVLFSVQDEELSDPHARAFGNRMGEVAPWASRLSQLDLTWIGAFDGRRLIGLVCPCRDGGLHAILLDTVADPQQPAPRASARSPCRL